MLEHAHSSSSHDEGRVGLKFAPDRTGCCSNSTACWVSRMKEPIRSLRLVSRLTQNECACRSSAADGADGRRVRLFSSTNGSVEIQWLALV